MLISAHQLQSTLNILKETKKKSASSSMYSLFTSRQKMARNQNENETPTDSKTFQRC